MTSVKICELLQSMAQICSLEDFEMIVEGILLEESPASALAMAKLISTSVTTVSLPSVIWSEEKVSKQAKQIAYKERLSRAFTKCARCAIACICGFCFVATFRGNLPLRLVVSQNMLRSRLPRFFCRSDEGHARIRNVSPI